MKTRRITQQVPSRHPTGIECDPSSLGSFRTGKEGLRLVGASQTRGGACRQGFTLLEILVAVSIMMILAAVVGINIAGRTSEGRIARASADIKNLQTALEMYRADNGRIPTPEQGLEALVRRPERPPIPRRYPEGGYLLSPNLPLDPWGRPYLYLVPGRQGELYEILSYGADGEPGGNGENAELSSSRL